MAKPLSNTETNASFLQNPEQMTKLKETAFKAARQAGSLLMERVGKIKSVDYKSAFNIVTDVDKASESLIISILKSDFPHTDILAEESGAHNTGDKQRWIIDPLDGTTNYTHSYPFFSVAIAFEENGEVILGVVYNPYVNEMFWAVKGQGAFLNNEPIKVSKNDALAKSLLATGFPADTKGSRYNNIKSFSTVTDLCHGVRRDGSAALDLCFVACGRLDGFWELKLSPWDTAGGVLIVREAGGKVSGLEGEDFDIYSGHVFASNGLIHQEVIDVLAKTREV
jgi:myo-inositol-1(or 4)-monophosphatase